MTRLLVLLLTLVPLAASAQQMPPMVSTDPLVVTSGQGMVQAVPDRAWAVVAVESRAANARDAQRANSSAMKAIQDKLKDDADIPSDAIRTVAYDVQPEFDNSSPRKVKGFVTRNTVEVRVDNIERLAEVLQIAGNSGATSLGGVRFDLKDRTRLEREALRQAVADARAKADAIAAGAGRVIDRIVRIEEQGVSGGPVPVMYRREMSLQAGVAAAAPPIEPGQTELRAQVTLTAVLK